MIKCLPLLLLALLPPPVVAQGPAQPPKLVVVIVIDQFRADYLQRFRPHFGTRGFNLFLRQGANFTQAEYQHAVTLTCPGHAVVLTGTHPAFNGIISNQWYDSRSGQQVYCAGDTLVSLIGSSDAGRSPRNLIGSTVGDQLKQGSGGRSRVIAVAGKDRSAIMLGGHQADGAYWMVDSLLVTSTHYMNELPVWVQRFNAPARVRRYAGKAWDRLLPRAAYATVGPDDVPAEKNVAGMGRAFPHPLPAETDPRFLDAFRSSPFQNELLLEFAMAAVRAEELGRDEAPDLLGLSLSANDLIGHAFGPASHEVMDVTLRTDRLLERFFNFLDREIGLPQVVVVLTADHGVAPLPEKARALNPGAGRLDPTRIADTVESALRSRFGRAPEGGWLAHMAPPWIYLKAGALRQRGIAIEEGERAARDAVRGVPQVYQALTATELRRQRQKGVASGAVFSFHPDRSGNVYYELRPYVVPGQEPSGTTHGSPWSYDARVPLLWFGASVKRGTHSRAVSVADVAPTLAAILGIAAPDGAQGQVLPEVMQP